MRIGQAARDYAMDAVRSGFRDAMRLVLWADAALVVLAFATAFLLPMRARRDGVAVH